MGFPFSDSKNGQDEVKRKLKTVALSAAAFPDVGKLKPKPAMHLAGAQDALALIAKFFEEHSH